MDIVVAHANSRYVSVLLGNSSGGFDGPTNFTAGFTLSMAVGDVNADGRLDVIIAEGTVNQAVVLLGNGDGTFAAPNGFATGADPIAVATADFNGDGHLDLAVGNDASQSVSLLLGSGTGAFAAPINVPAGNGPRSVAAGDLNGDGNPDLLVAQYGLEQCHVPPEHPESSPVSTFDSYATQENTVLSIAAPGVLGNDADQDGDAMTAELVSGPGHGALTLNPNGSFTYTPAASLHRSGFLLVPGHRWTSPVQHGNGRDHGTISVRRFLPTG
jgi:hypothetical protein